jgi:tRNA threonylcarbamoyladenosine biosynthesis protein TsaE
MKVEIKSKSAAETKKLGKILAKKVLQEEETVFIALKGNLGGGKTTFTKGFAKGMGITEEINSPTFLIYKKYKGKKELYHFDAYRIKEKDLDLLNFEEILKERGNVIIVEWSENIEKRIPNKKITISFFFLSPKERMLIVEDNSGIIKDSFL